MKDEVYNKIFESLKTVGKLNVDYAVNFTELYATHEKVMNISMKGYTFTAYYETDQFCMQYPNIRGVNQVIFWEKDGCDCFCESLIHIAQQKEDDTKTEENS